MFESPSRLKAFGEGSVDLIQIMSRGSVIIRIELFLLLLVNMISASTSQAVGGSQYNRSILAATTHTWLAYHAAHFNSQKSYLKTPLFCIETDKHKDDDDSDVMRQKRAAKPQTL